MFMKGQMLRCIRSGGGAGLDKVVKGRIYTCSGSRGPYSGVMGNYEDASGTYNSSRFEVVKSIIPRPKIKETVVRDGRILHET